jgi:hypothetical protein
MLRLDEDLVDHSPMPRVPPVTRDRRRRRARARRSRVVPVLALVAALTAAVLVIVLATGPTTVAQVASLDLPAARPAEESRPQARPREGPERRRPRERAAEEDGVRQAHNGPPSRAWTHRDLDRVRWRSSVALGSPHAGGLVRGVLLPARGDTYVTWDPVRRTTPNRADRRYGTARLVRTVLEVAAAHAKAHPDAPRIVVGDLSRPRGGDFGVRFGDLGDGKAHVSHQNGLDVDVYYPRADGRERGLSAGGPDDLPPIDRALAQDLVDRFVAAGARFVFVGTATGLTGPGGVVVAEARHNDHMHVRLPAG